MMMSNSKAMELIKIIFSIVIVILAISSCLSTENITLTTYKIPRTKRIVESQSITYSFHAREGKVIEPGLGNHEISATEIFDDFAFSFFLLSIKNLLTLFSKLILILSFFQFFLYIRGWIILVFQVKYRFFVTRYLELVDGKKNQLVFQ